jgi:hypothetical protein
MIADTKILRVHEYKDHGERGELVLGQLGRRIERFIQDNLKNVALLLLASINQEINKQIAKVLVAIPGVFLLNCEERVLKIRIVGLFEPCWMFLLKFR